MDPNVSTGFTPMASTSSLDSPPPPASLDSSKEELINVDDLDDEPTLSMPEPDPQPSTSAGPSDAEKSDTKVSKKCTHI